MGGKYAGGSQPAILFFQYEKDSKHWALSRSFTLHISSVYFKNGLVYLSLPPTNALFRRLSLFQKKSFVCSFFYIPTQTPLHAPPLARLPYLLLSPSFTPRLENATHTRRKKSAQFPDRRRRRLCLLFSRCH